MEQLLPLLIIPVLLTIGYISGSAIERRHFAALRQEETQTRKMILVTFPKAPAEWEVHDPALVCGSVVISLDYFKRFLAGLKALVGGRITAYEPLLDRARREALLRMKRNARTLGYETIVNVRLETSCIGRSAGNNKGVAGVEVLAFGTAVRRSD